MNTPRSALATAALLAALSGSPAHAQEPAGADAAVTAHARRAAAALGDGSQAPYAAPVAAAAPAPAPEKSLIDKLLYVSGEEGSLEHLLGYIYRFGALAVALAYLPTYYSIRKIGLPVRSITWLTFGTVNTTGLAFGLASGNMPLAFTMTPATAWCFSIVRADHKEKAMWRRLGPVVGLVREKYRGRASEAIALGRSGLAETASKLRALYGQPALAVPAAGKVSEEDAEACLASCMAYVESELKLKFLQMRRQSEPQDDLEADAFRRAGRLAAKFVYDMWAGVFPVASDDRTARRIESLKEALGNPDDLAWAEIDQHMAVALQQWASRQNSPSGGLTEKFRKDSAREETGAES